MTLGLQTLISKYKPLFRFEKYLLKGFQRGRSQFANPQYENGSYLFKPLVFTGFVTAGTFGGAAILQYELTRKSIKKRGVRRWSKRKSHEFRDLCNKWWNALHEGQKVATGIIGLNILVFALWQIPRNRAFMTTWFTSSPSVRKTSPLLLSCFSHSEVWHIGANMFVLWSFSPLIQSLLGSEQFLAFYISGGTISSLMSHYFKVASKSRIPSLGASGALLAVLAACCIERPEARLSILFLPFFTFTAQTALYSIIALDVTGILLRWKLFDHAGHLGGTMFGSWYTLYGHKYIWDKRPSLVRHWHEMRSK